MGSVDRVLVVDDDAALRNLTALVCRRAGFDVDTACDGARALEMIRSTEYLVAILDLQMPNMNGFDVIEQLQSLRRRPAIIVLTALPPSAYVGLDPSVVQAIVRKPFDVDLLSAMIGELASLARKQWGTDLSDSDHSESLPS